MPRIDLDPRVGKTVAGSDYTKPGRTRWMVDVYVVRDDGGRSLVDSNASLISADDADKKAANRVARHGDHWLRVYG